MFTGIVEHAIPVGRVSTDGDLGRIEIDLSALDEWTSVKPGDSVALNGCCLTVAGLDKGIATFEAIPETLRLTSLGDIQAGASVNVERAMKAGARFDGHLVQGHVDGVGEVAAIDEVGGEWRVTIDCGREFAGQCVLKGSVCIDGVSLTIAGLTDDALTVAIVPHTRKVTNIRTWRQGTRVNLEADVIGKYVRRHFEGMAGGQVSEDLLRRAGFTD